MVNITVSVGGIVLSIGKWWNKKEQDKGEVRGSVTPKTRTAPCAEGDTG